MAISETKGTSGPSWMCWNKHHWANRLKETQRIAKRDKEVAYYLVKVKSLGRVWLDPIEEEERFLGGFKARGQS